MATVRLRTPRTILIIPFADGIGDFVNMLPIIQAIRERYPRSAHSVAASDHARPLLPDDSVTVVTPRWLRRQTSPGIARFRWLVSQRLLATLSGLAIRTELGHFDLTINLFRAWERGMAFERDWTPQLPARPDAEHSLDFLANRLAALDVQLAPSKRAPRLVVRPEARTWAAGLWRQESLDAAPVVGLVPSSNMEIKQWPLGAWAKLNDALRRWGARTMLFLPDTTHPSRRLLDRAAHPPIPLVTDLTRVAAALERCALVVAVDTGLLHMAAAVGTPYVGLFGPTNPAVTGPYDRALGTCLVAPFAKGRRCGGCWKSFKYEDDRCRAIDVGSCASLLDGHAVLSASLALLGGVRLAR